MTVRRSNQRLLKIQNMLARKQYKGLLTLIKSINKYNFSAYFLDTTVQAVDIIYTVCPPNHNLMSDCYHVRRTEWNVVERFETIFPIIEYIQCETYSIDARLSTGNSIMTLCFRK